MDFLDPKKRRQQQAITLVGYVLIGIALAFGTYVLLQQAYGFGLNKDGEVVQNGLVFAASTPSGADVRINGELEKAQTDTRLSIEAGEHSISYSREGYRSWQQTFTLQGGSIQRLDYAMLIPTQLKTSITKTYTGPIGMATQSPDRRWLVVQIPGTTGDFDIYDLRADKLAPTRVSLPSNAITAGTSTSWGVSEWANDNEHVVLNHVHDGATEFILLDRANVAESVNLNSLLGMNPTKLSLIDKKYDRYYVYDAAAQTLQKASIGAPQPAAYLTDVLEYQTYGDDVVLYASSKTTTPGKVGVVLLLGGKSYFLRELSGNTMYLLNLTQYERKWYVAIGASSENKVYVYKNPDKQLNSTLGLLVPVSVLKTPAPNHLAFSSSARFIMSENGSQFSVYDAEEDKSIQYDTHMPLDAPQKFANWLDGSHLTYVSGGKLVLFDYNHTNVHSLVAADPAVLPFFRRDYKYVDVVAPASNGTQSLTATALRTAADL